MRPLYIPCSDLKSGLKNLLKNGLLLVVTLIITTLLSEVIVRQVFHPVDYLLPKTETDQFLGHRISSGSGGHDDWGFRNYSIPQKTRIVAIGDSQTYGTMATHKESWPAHLSNSLNTQVYNLALGGYGPIQYLYLLESLALKLEPEVVIIALYYGNDLFDAYRAAYSNPNWARFKNPDLSKQKVEKIAIGGGTLEYRFLGDLRGWMASNSVLYRLSTQSFLGNFVREMEFLSRDTEIIDIELKGVRHFFSPEYRLSALDRQSQMVQEGLRISKAAFNEIHSLSMPHNIRLVVVAIPTKERVYEDFLIDVL